MDQLPATSDEKSWAMAAHALTFVEGGIVGPLILYVVKKDQSQFVAFHALQSVYFGLLAFAIILPITIVTCGLGAVLFLPYLCYEVVATVEAGKGEWYFLPIAGNWAWQRHHPGAEKD